MNLIKRHDQALQSTRSRCVGRLWLIILSSFLLCACVSQQPRKEPAKIPAFKDAQSTSPKNAIRISAVRDTAVTVGAQAGLAWRSKQIDNMLQKSARHLDKIFNFNALLLRDEVLPPVLAQADNTMKVSDNAQTLRLSHKTYKIVSPPRFVTASPNWRGYLWLDYKKPETPNSTLLPRTAKERQTWNKYIDIGWKQGVNQANEIFSANLGRLKRDFEGMVLYRKLLAQNMVSAPFVATAKLGVTGGDKQLRINDQVLRITSTSKLKANSKKWKPVLYNRK